MKKISLLIFVVGVILLIFSNAHAYPGNITIDSQQYSGNDYTAGFQKFFENGTYEFSVGSGAWNTYGSFPGGWIWSANIYQESTGLDIMLGDNSKHNTSDLALSTHANDSSVEIMVNNPSGEYLSFYINDSSEYNNRHNVNMNVNVAVVPEPVSSTLFVLGGLVFVGRRYLKKRK